MDLDHIRTFVAIARGRSFSHAANALHRSQPAISRRIEMLEGELGATLFERARGGVLLTDSGAALLPYAEAVLATMKDGADAVQAQLKGRAGKLSLALVGSLANARLTGALRRFMRRFPKVRLDVQTANSAEVSDLVRRGAATLGLRYVADGSPELISREIARERLVVVGNPRHRLADSRRHKAKDLAGERWVAFPAQRSRESFVRFLDRKLLAVGLDDAEIVPIDSLTAQKRLVEAGFGVALLAESGVEEELRVGALKRLNVPELRASIPVALIHRRTGYLSAAAHELISAIATSLG